MFDITIAAYLFSVLAGVTVIFQLGLAIGLPWGEMAMGGKFPGRFPPHMRLAAVVQIVLLVLIVGVVLTRAGIVLDEFQLFSQSAIWLVVAFCMLGTILNTITPSKKERMLWAPVNLVLLVCSVVIANY